MGRVLRTTLSAGKGGVVHLFVVYGYQGAEEDADQLKLTDQLLQAVLAEEVRDPLAQRGRKSGLTKDMLNKGHRPENRWAPTRRLVLWQVPLGATF